MTVWMSSFVVVLAPVYFVKRATYTQFARHHFIFYDCFVKIYLDICPLSFHVLLQHPIGMLGHIVFWFRKLLQPAIMRPALKCQRRNVCFILQQNRLCGDRSIFGNSKSQFRALFLRISLKNSMEFIQFAYGAWSWYLLVTVRASMMALLLCWRWNSA